MTQQRAVPRLGILLVVVGILVAACGSTPAPTPTPTAGPTAIAEVPTPARPATQPSRDVGAVFQSGPFLVTIGEAVHDTVTKQLFLAVRFQNLGESWMSPGGDASLLLGGQALHPFPLRNVLARVPPGRTSDETFVIDVGDADPLVDGILRWGRDDETQTSIRLVDGSVDGFGGPREIDLDAWGQIGREAIHITRATLYGDALGAPRAPTGQHVLRLVFDEYNSSPSFVNGFVPSDQVTLALPDGTAVDALAGSTGRTLQPSWTSSIANHVDFAVPADPTGHYEARLASVSRTAMGTFHTELIDRVALPFDISLDNARPASIATAPSGSLPRADLPVEAPTAPAADQALETPWVNVPGSTYRATGIRWNPDAGVVTLDGEARLVAPIVAPDDGLLSTPSVFQPYVSLDVGGRLLNGIQHDLAVYTITAETPTNVAYDFDLPSLTDLDEATLYLGIDGMAPSLLPLGTAQAAAADPPAPIEGSIAAPPVTVGNYTVQLAGYRLGLTRELDRPAAGGRTLEVIMDVTAHQVENPGAFGLLFAPGTQLFVALPDGYLQPAMSSDTAFFEADGETRRVAATYLVPVAWTPGEMAFTARSRDEIRDITSDGWTEVTFGARAEPPAGAAPTSSGPPDGLDQ